jgi:hypothetical protein
MSSEIDLDKATLYLESMIKGYRQSLKDIGEIQADDLRMHFAGAKDMLRVLGGDRATDAAIRRLRDKGLKIPPSGLRMDGEIRGSDMDSDLDFFEWALS